MQRHCEHPNRFENAVSLLHGELAPPSASETHLRPLVLWVDVAEHGQRESSRLTRTRLGLGNQILRSGAVTDTCRHDERRRSVQKTKYLKWSKIGFSFL